MNGYHDILLAGWVNLFVLGFCLLSVSCPRKLVFKAYNRARRLLGLAYLVLGLEILLLWAFPARQEAPHVAGAINLTFSGFCAVLLNFSFCGLLDRRYLSTRRWMREAGIWTAFSGLLWGLLYAVPAGFRLHVLLCCALFFFGNVLRVCLSIIRAYRRAQDSLDNYYADEKAHFARWLLKSALGIIGLGLIGAFLCFAPAPVNAVYMLVTLVFFVYVYISMHNYLINYPQVETAVLAQKTLHKHVPATGEVGPQKEKLHPQLQEALEAWIARKGYLTPGITIEKLAQACGTNRLYLSAYINQAHQVNFRDFVNGLRLDFAAALIEAHPQTPVADVAQASGFSSSAYFSRLFQKHRGVLPMQYKKDMIKKALILCVVATGLFQVACAPSAQQERTMNLPIEETLQAVLEQQPRAQAPLLRRGVEQCAALWRTEDGSAQDFQAFVTAQYVADPAARDTLFRKLSTAFEALFGTANQAAVELQKPVHLTGGELTDIDYVLSGYSPGAHFTDDMFANKVAFTTVLNFPHYTLEEKNAHAAGEEAWSRKDWAYARLGDVFTTRVPARVQQQLAAVYGDSENYIAAYNIMMGQLLTEDGRQLFPSDMVLLSHWNLRDEIKSNYAQVPDALEKQQMIYKVMEHIACQTIPQEVINNPAYQWKPFSNTLWQNGKEVQGHAEGDRRYAHILATYHAEREIDAYSPQLSTGILRNFEGGMEVSAQEIETLFTTLLSSPLVGEVAARIQARLGRELQPYDIWYDGFKARAALPEDRLTEQTRALYPTPEAFRADMPRMLGRLGFSPEKARYLQERIVVEGARGSGHAWGAVGRWEPSRLRTRIGEKGMDYKGYNIAVHEFGHNVEQTLSLYDVDYFTLAGVPNTAFTEALAFIFQKRDLLLLGHPQAIDHNTTLDIFWGAYEIMGVSLVDMYTWRWIYDHPQATAAELRDAVLDLARKVWNQYFSPVLGSPDSPILAIYSHMVNSPMYLPNYPFGHLVEFQLEAYLAQQSSPAAFAAAIERMFTLGRLTPNAWMREAVGAPVSVQPLLDAVEAILRK